MSEANLASIARHQDIERQHAAKKQAERYALPTNDDEVKSMLRQLGHPICLFGEDQAFRRERLRDMITAYFQEYQTAPEFEGRPRTGADSSSDDEPTGKFYSEGTAQLREARVKIAKFSLPLGQRRVEQAQAL